MMVTVARLMRGTILESGEVFINARPFKPGKVVVRLFDKQDRIVTRVWNSNAVVMVVD